MRFLLAAILVASTIRTVAADERIEIFSDEALTDKTLIDSHSRIVDLYVAHFDTPATTGCLFRIAPSPGFTGVWLGDSSSWVTVGTTQSGIAIGYGKCMMGSNVLVKVSYQLFGTSSCSTLTLAEHPILIPGGPYCDACFGEYRLPSNSLAVNCAVGTQSTTWGRVKALYR